MIRIESDDWLIEHRSVEGEVRRRRAKLDRRGLALRLATQRLGGRGRANGGGDGRSLQRFDQVVGRAGFKALLA